ncbi:amino acid/amide ABC transporter membrane protein 2, HAAT family [Streptomyces sp. DvalAA-14]|uniref:branched-chain amino acid ABC transporter permease n=1 Tax=unclassified Streptomyces TaxID=2593676 RepID=UPI00081B381B|nr:MULTISPECIES: branched-chain amino acid ABC transporter permease [unclassified Streptomyces]MYS20662.1 branched-chain amino acid ABC transporter permease [Streptomyces sp. SID4948]SCD74105.1 amino acid/amide ABC transporter membrane protein 2, HAAT family [Streptomyces sp. DvalAA-14]
MTDIPAVTTLAATPPATRRTEPFIPLPLTAARAVTLLGAAVTIASTFLSWTYTTDFPGDLTVTGYPGGLQVITLIGGILALLLALAAFRVKGLSWLVPSRSNNAVLAMALGTLATTWYTVIAIAEELGGLANVDPGGFVAAIGSLLLFLGTLALPIDRQPEEDDDTEYYELGRFAETSLIVSAYRALRSLRLNHSDLRIGDPRKLNPWLQRLTVVVVFAVGLKILTFGIATDYTEIFIGYLLVIAFGVWALSAAGLLRQFQQLTQENRRFTAAVGVLAAIAYPFAQNNEHWANLGVNILIFGTVALGLNIVVGLTGLLDLGYVAFLGVGAYAAALVSGSAFSVWSGVQFPFWAAALTGMAAALVFGVLIGAPTLRLRGDYLAIVTLGFGEIFRIAVNNLDGVSGPKVTNGPNGISQIPDLSIFGYNLGNPHEIGSFTLGRFANYYLLMLVITIIVVLIFTRAADSRIGRSWVAIREDETAATAMGINSFRVKLIAFALGASLAGLAGTVSAHVTYSVVPNPYQFAGSSPPNSAFLLAAVVLGGMGTVSGPILGAALLYLIPEKLGFIQRYELLGFGIALILIMRFRPEGIIPNRRRQLEFHEDDTLIPGQRPLGDDTVPASTAGA